MDAVREDMTLVEVMEQDAEDRTKWRWNHDDTVDAQSTDGDIKQMTVIVLGMSLTRALLRLVWPASRLTRTPLARRRWKRLIHQRDVTI